MKLNEKATKAARRRQNEGIARLRAYFQWTQIKGLTAGIQNGNGTPYRRKPGVPVLRDEYHVRKHRKRKISRASRKANRG